MLWKISQIKTVFVFLLAFIGSTLSGVVHALPIPSALTESDFNLSVQLSGVELYPAPFLPTSASVTTTTAATAVDAVGDFSGHSATADSRAAIQAHDRVSKGGSLSPREPVFNITMANRTLAQSWWNGPVGARATAGSQAGFDNVDVTVAPGAALTLAWDFDLLNIRTTPLASRAMMQHMVSIALTPRSSGASESQIFSVGFSAVSRDGEIEWTAYDIRDSTAIKVWLGDTLSQLSTGVTTPLTGPTVIIPLAPRTTVSGVTGEDFTLSLEVSHVEMATEAPLAPARPVGELALAKSNETSAQVHWDADTGQLSFDLLPLNMLFDASGRSMTEAQGDLLAGAYLKIDPLVQEEGAAGYFKGSGDLQLVAKDGEVLVQAAMPGLLYDERLYASEGFNLFAPLLDSKVFDLGSSQWLRDFFKRMNSDVFFLPELFVDIGLPAEADPTDDRWALSFDAPVNAALSFAGPEVSVSIPGTTELFLIGMSCWLFVRSRRFMFSLK